MSQSQFIILNDNFLYFFNYFPFVKCNFQSIRNSTEISKQCLNKHISDIGYAKAIKVKAIYSKYVEIRYMIKRYEIRRETQNKKKLHYNICIHQSLESWACATSAEWQESWSVFWITNRGCMMVSADSYNSACTGL